MSTWGPAILSSGIAGAVVSLIIAVMNRRHTKALAKQVENAAEREEVERDNLLAEATGKWSKLLNETRTEAYKEIDQRCRRCEAALARRDESIDRLIDAVTELIPLVPAGASETANVRAAIQAARRARYGTDAD
ncbi:membrane protein [Mycobacterium phage ThulaThula]|uniref:Membrane protein n=1 Tax=Mycobacterium phage ThulaThula TaxID=2599880 RepID=A0A5J6TH90_9CAUD|nr:membrane protein [Mycobacterium phage ThulaThula]QFG09059.1 membrane protein [Mycobacterium phage ThulaThula]